MQNRKKKKKQGRELSLTEALPEIQVGENISNEKNIRHAEWLTCREENHYAKTLAVNQRH